jgi:phosphoserine phosphatase
MKVGAIICDMDGTAVQYPNGDFSSSWDILTELLSEKEKEEWFSLIKENYGTGNYDKWFKSELKLLKGKKLCDAENFCSLYPTLQDSNNSLVIQMD